MAIRIIDGGAKTADKVDYIFGEITDTRLMGVLGMHLCLGIDGKMVHQLYYFDIEELGLDGFNVLSDPEEPEVIKMLRSNLGGLGAKMVTLNKREAYYLANFFTEKTRSLKQPLPPNIKEIDWMLEDPPVLSEEELDALNSKICVPIENDFGAVNYFLMRCFGKDQEGAKLLVHPDAKPEDIDFCGLEKHSTFLKNTIDEFTDKDGSVSYVSEAVVESGNSYWIVTCDTRVKDRRILSAREIGRFRISPVEASMKLNRREFVTVYGVLTDLDRFELVLDDFTIGANKTDHAAGIMYMKFKPDNSHAQQRIFCLNDDVKAVFFLTDGGQLIAGSYTEGDIFETEAELIELIEAKHVFPIKRFCFDESLLYDFAESNYIDFFEYLLSLSPGE